ncbi:MAG: alpha-glucan family phosphorylase [Actinomycetota bacterium]
MNDAEVSAALTRLARSHTWTWSATARDLFDALDTDDGARHHPTALVAEADPAVFVAMADNPDFVARLEAELARTPAPRTERPDVAYFSPEFGISELLPQYSGGLGILAGDHLKAANDLDVSLCGVGLFYRQGFFSQGVVDGQQSESYPTYTPEGLGCVDTGVTVTVPVPGRQVSARVWRMDVGTVPLLLLDTDVAVNAAGDRAITDRLYSGDRRHRLEQEMILGVGGARALTALGWDVPVHHLNEGHAGFLILELLDRRIAAGDSLADAHAALGPGLVFTTHTPVPAGIDRFEPELATEYLKSWAAAWKIRVDDLLALGTDPQDDPPAFNMAAFCLRTAARTNGVSKLHGEISRKLFAAVPGGDAITSVTNGVHARTWIMPELQALFDDALGAGWADGDPDAWAAVASLDAAAIAEIRRLGALRLQALVKERLGAAFDPEALTVGFARRFATYKRANLLLQPAEELAALLADDDRPVQFVFAGKAHPADGPGKALLADIVRYAGTDEANGRFLFVPDYDVEVAQALYAGCDVWLNNPIRPREASGTSGEKSALNGGLNCSISDGWWDEMADDRNGWTIPGSDADDPAERDTEEAADTLALLGGDVLTTYYDGGAALGPAWIERVRHVWASLGPQVTAARMVADYQRTLYGPALDAVAAVSTT